MGCFGSKEAPAGAPAAAGGAPAKASAGEPDAGAVHSAIRWKKPMSEIKSLITDKASATVQDPQNGNYPIHIASQNGHNEILRHLLAKGADPNAQNFNGQTPLHMAVSYDYDETAALLVGAGADGEIENKAHNKAKFGIDGEKDPTSPEFAMGKFKEATAEADLLHALDLIKANPPEEKSDLVSAGLKVKKKEGVQWTPAVQAKFGETVAAL